MKLNQYSTYGLNNALRTRILDSQERLAGAQKELSSGKVEDPGLTLGEQTGTLKLLENNARQIRQTIQTNSFLASRMTVMQDSLSAIIDATTNYNGALTGELGGTLDRKLLSDIARSALGSIESGLNANINGEYVFSGIISDAPALVDYEGATGVQAKAAVQAAFTSFFGFAADDPMAAGIDRASMDSFIDGPFADLFNDANWQTLWSPASSDGMRAKIGLREIAELPSTAFAESYREVVAAAVLMREFADTQISRDTVDHLATRAIELGATGTSGLASEQSKIGVLEERVESSTQRLRLQRDVIESRASEMTSVDAYEAAVRVNSLILSLEASYSATARLQSLSILNFI